MLYLRQKHAQLVVLVFRDFLTHDDSMYSVELRVEKSLCSFTLCKANHLQYSQLLCLFLKEDNPCLSCSNQGKINSFQCKTEISLSEEPKYSKLSRHSYYFFPIPPSTLALTFIFPSQFSTSEFSWDIEIDQSIINHDSHWLQSM